MPRATPNHLFGGASGIEDYLELCRFFVYDWCPKNTATQFLACTHRLIKRHAPRVKWLYTYAAGFQGMIGTIYQAANYEYIGRQLCSSFIWVPGHGLIHDIARWHRYGSTEYQSLKGFSRLVPDARTWCGYNFRYIYWLCDAREKARLMASAQFTAQPYPTEADLEIWVEDLAGNKTPMTKAQAKAVPIISFPSRGKVSERSSDSAVPGPPGEGGATPTRSLHSRRQ
jgi:hypothetical protein